MDLVTGGTGFVGWHVVRALSERGDGPVRALVRPNVDASYLEELSGVEIVRGDLLDAESLERATRGCRRVFHVAALYTFWARDSRLLYRTNVDGTRALLDAAAAAGVERIVYTSTVGALGYAGRGKPADESTPVRLEDMVGHYKRSKFLAERVAMEAVAHGTPVVIVNPSAPVGWADRKPTPTGQMIYDFMRGRMKGYLETGLNLVDVEDVAAGHLLAAERGVAGEKYILGNRDLYLKEIFEILSDLTGVPAPRVKIPYALAWTVGAANNAWAAVARRAPPVPLESVRIAKKTMFFDATKARRELDLPQTEPAVALEKAVRWFRERSAGR